jgi:hypothetical protein
MIHSVWDSVTEFTKISIQEQNYQKTADEVLSTLGVDDPILYAKN